MVEEVDYWGQSRRYGYDGSGHLLWSEDPLHRRIDYVCDPLGRILRKAFVDERAASLGQDGPAVATPTAATTQPLFVETFAYDANGNLTETANPHVKVTRQFDADGRMIEEVQAHTHGESFTVRNRYDAAGNRTQRQTESSAGPGHLIEYGFDLLDQSIEVRIDGGAPIRAQRDALGQITDEQLAPGLARRYRYDADGRMTEQSLTKDGQSLFATHYDYDRVGNLTQRSDSHFGIDRYVYDPMGRILEHCDPQGRLQRFFNDPAGDRLITRLEAVGDTATQVNGHGDGWAREGDYRGVRYRFDRAGNLVEKSNAQQQLQLRWDAEQRLIASRRSTGHDAPRVTAYAYDPLGRRLYKETAGQRTWFGWDGEALTFENEPTALAQEIVHRPCSFAPLAQLAVSQAPRHVCTEPNGAPTRLFDASGTLLWATHYTANRAAEVYHATAEARCALRLQNQYFDEETGFAYNRHRYFDAHSGQFLSQDPIGLSGGENLFSIGPNTLGYRDPLGLSYAKGTGKAAKGIGARVEAVHGALDPIAAGRRTTAALDTVEGTRVLAAGARDLSPAQRALMAPGEVAAKLPGAHAEVTALQHAAQNGLTPAQMAVSRTICASCRAAIEQSGGQLTSPTTAIWPR